jgi:hypothetical protein
MATRKSCAKGAVFGAVLDRGKAISHRCLYRAQKNLNRMSRLAANNSKATDFLSSKCGAKRGRLDTPPHALPVDSQKCTKTQA